MKRAGLGGGVILLVVMLLLVSCSPSPPNYFAYTEQSLRAELRGKLHGNDFVALLELKHDPNGLKGGSHIRIEYLAPESMKGIMVLAPLDTGEGIFATATLGELSLRVLRESVAGWLLPADLLLALRDDPIERVERREEGFFLTFEEGITLLVDREGMPLALRSDAVDLKVVWWEPIF